MIQCQVCRVTYVANTIFCAECGAYLLRRDKLTTDPIEIARIRWLGDADGAQVRDKDLSDTGPLAIRLCISNGDQARELEIWLVRPIRLGRNDPTEDIYPELDLTQDRARQYGVSREHACIFQRGNAVEVEDLGSTNGTLLNGKRLAPYMPKPLKDGDQLQLGKLLVEVALKSRKK